MHYEQEHSVFSQYDITFWMDIKKDNRIYNTDSVCQLISTQFNLIQFSSFPSQLIWFKFFWPKNVMFAERKENTIQIKRVQFYGKMLDKLWDLLCAKTFCPWVVLQEISWESKIC